MATIRKHVIRNIVTLDAAVSCREAARLMSERKIGSIGVRVNGKLTGLVTERDIVTAVAAKGADGSLPLGDATRDLPRISPDATEAECAQVMKAQVTRHLLVEERGEIVGMISMRDLIQLMLDEKQFLIEQLQAYIAGR